VTSNEGGSTVSHRLRHHAKQGERYVARKFNGD
jgi:hypothetical protein